ncbi:hypothetical protein FPZ54_12465 [Sphingomonas suaedae]|uniref:DUF3800 domain-containing protein n=1 Tax=Sphingomonas suaedae TaxID=2599297 RepID=A0A518RH16_9SPHN|nr:DUF3800 domain-containing protein [Sphingomonas suaedae]QDX26742.1 hypothetical protein FPZ54_12465 [Sphingomonas suaedae]
MIDVNPLRDAILAAHDLSNVDEVYTFYYDETNNVRKLHLTPDGMNIRRPDCFVLGGIVHPGLPRPIDLGELRRVFRLQPSAREIKLKHLGGGEFRELLGCEKVELFLDWLTAQGFLVHYQVTDVLYWSTVDIVDSILTEMGKPRLIAMHLPIKDSLYTVLRDDVDGTAELLGRYSYPDVGRERRAAFVAELLDLVEYREHMLEHFPFYMLKGVLQAARGLDALPYLEDETPNVLIDGFGTFFSNRLCLFKNARHILDDEKQIEAYLEALGLCDGAVPLRHYRFANSQSEEGVQLSDLVAGLLGKLFTYVNRTPLDELAEDMAELSDRQRRSLKLLSRLLDRSTDECPAFAQYVISAEDQQRADFVLNVSTGGM